MPFSQGKFILQGARMLIHRDHIDVDEGEPWRRLGLRREGFWYLAPHAVKRSKSVTAVISLKS
jgi:hypothetical protein